MRKPTLITRHENTWTACGEGRDCTWRKRLLNMQKSKGPWKSNATFQQFKSGDGIKVKKDARCEGSRNSGDFVEMSLVCMLGLQKNRDERWLELKWAVPFLAVELWRFATVQFHCAKSHCACNWLFRRFSNNCRKSNIKVITPTNQRRSKQSDEPIRIPTNYL